jgi:arylsulfatase A-like enzyme
MRNLSFLFLCFSLLSCSKSISKISQETINPNILFIVIDDLNDWSPSLGNHPKVQTPNIDRLALQGMIFKNAHCQAPLCAPSRASVYTGMHPHSTGIYYQLHDKQIKKSSKKVASAIFLPDYFEKFGYKTLGAGKLLHNGDSIGIYDTYGGIFPEMGFGPRPTERVNYHWKWFNDKYKTATDWAPIELEDSNMSDYKIAEWAIEELKKQHNKPFFLSVGFIRPHVPWHVPQKWFDMFPVENMEVPPYKADDLDDVPEISRKIHDMPGMPKTDWLIKEDKWKPMIQAYLACMAFVDEQVGKVLNALEKSEYAENTIIVLWSDHGYHLGEKNRTCKHSLWNRSTHVPLIFAGYGIKQEQSTNVPVGLIDIYPTLVELCGLEENINNEGHSLVPLLQDSDMKWEHPVFTSYGYKNISMYIEDFHFIQYENGEVELYDMVNDNNEWVNLANNPVYKKQIEYFREKLPDNYTEHSPYSFLSANSFIDSLIQNRK